MHDTAADVNVDDGRALCLAGRLSAGDGGLWGVRGPMFWRADPQQSEASPYKPTVLSIYYTPHIIRFSPLRKC